MSLIETYKQKHNIKTSEDLFDISEPPEYQCKKIDSLIDKVKIIYKVSRGYERMDEDELKSVLSDVSWEFDGMDREIEELREAIENLRQWGYEWKEFAKELIEKNQVNIGELV